MTGQYHTLICAEDLAALVTNNAPLRIFDCRAQLGNPQRGAELFAIGHIAGALHADLDQHLSDPPDERGRHPLPTRRAWLAQVQRWGLQPQEQVVVYDDIGGQMAARAWWMMRWLGHEAVAVLDGGLQHWPMPLETGAAPTPQPSNFSASTALTRLWQVGQVMENLQTQDHALLDARTEVRFRGEEEPIDPVAGHIPDAVCLPSAGNLDETGLFKSPQALRQRFAHLQADKTVCYCGSGVTATHNVLAMKVAGLAEPALYADSWSGWITDRTRPIGR